MKEVAKQIALLWNSGAKRQAAERCERLFKYGFSEGVISCIETSGTELASEDDEEVGTELAS